MGITVLCPTRKRTWALDRMLKSLEETKTTDIKILVYVDNDDNESINYIKDNKIQGLIGARERSVNNIFNILAHKCQSDIMMTANDDIIFTEKGWDQKVIDAFNNIPDHIAVVHGWNHNREKTFGEHPFIHMDMVKVLGYILPPYFVTDYGDHWMWELSERIGRNISLDIFIDHPHFRDGKAIYDQTYQERRALWSQQRPDRLYEVLAPTRDADVEKLKKYINDYKSN
jgi:hypothetical protein